MRLVITHIGLFEINRDYKIWIMNLCKCLIAVTLSYAVISCGRGSEDSSVISEGPRDNIVKIATDKIVSLDDSLPIMHTCGIMLYGDTLLFDDHINDEFKFTAYDISQGKVIGRFGKPGNGPGELANYGATFYDGDTHTLYVTEANQGKVLGFYLPDAISNPIYTPFVKARMSFVNKAYSTPHYINDSTVICSTISRRNKKTGIRSSHIGRLNLINQSLTELDTLPDTDNISYVTAVSPEQDMIYATGRNKDEIRIYTINGELLKTIYGPDYDEKVVNRKKYFSGAEFCGDNIMTIYAAGKENKGQDIVVMDRDGMYVKTLRFSVPLHDIKYHKKTDRLYISTDAAPQFGYIENFGRFVNEGKQEVQYDKNVKTDKDAVEDATMDVADTHAEPVERKVAQDDKPATASDDGKVKCIASDPAAAAAAKTSGGKSSAGPLTLIDTNASGAHVDHLKVGAYPEGDGKYLYTIGLFNRSDEPVEIASICLPDGYFKASWSTVNTLRPNMVGFLRLMCDKPLENKEYPVIVHFRDEKHPTQTLCMTLYRSGAQLYNEMHNN